jgi:alkanesulfonate monooxygenase SsuD/methylene tetrahydromethanopterin reductase-like flavin-dependent oxidoreductase (luciferase family)
MRFAVTLPQHVPDGSFQPNELRDYLGRAEELGFEGAWITEQVVGLIPHPNPAEMIAFAAALNDALRFGCAVHVTPLHHPIHLAKSISTLDQLTRGRLEVGVGIGGRARLWPAFGIDDDVLVTRFLEGLQVMKALWTEPRATVPGRFWPLEQIPMEPKPFQKPHPPVWFGASHPAALRRAVEHGNGFFGAGSSTTAAFTEQVRIVHAALHETGRSQESFRIAKRVYVAVDDDPDRARQRMAAELAAFYGPFAANLGPVAVTGTPAECIAGVQAVADAGAELILLNALFDLPEQMERLAADVIPEVVDLQ